MMKTLLLLKDLFRIAQALTDNYSDPESVMDMDFRICMPFRLGSEDG